MKLTNMICLLSLQAARQAAADQAAVDAAAARSSSVPWPLLLIKR